MNIINIVQYIVLRVELLRLRKLSMSKTKMLDILPGFFLFFFCNFLVSYKLSSFVDITLICEYTSIGVFKKYNASWLRQYILRLMKSMDTKYSLLNIYFLDGKNTMSYLKGVQTFKWSQNVKKNNFAR